MLRINALVHRIAGRTLLDGATLAVPDGQRAALVGRNGTGKTTLLRLIAGEIEPDGGTIAVHPGARVAMVAQTAPAGAQSVIETVLAADHERSRLLAEADVATEPGRIADIQTRLADIAAHSAPARAGAILHGLGFDSDAQARPLDAFSGGWRMRVALATVLFAEPDLLLLDEPTNHLDLEATLWLEQFLGRWPRTLVMVSHDRDLVNRVARRTIHLDRRRLTAYAGGFDAFERARRERLELDAKTRAKQAAKRRHIQAFVDRFRAQANKARQAQSRIKALERLPAPMPVINERPVILAFPEPLPLAPPLITLDEAAVGYAADRAVLDRLNLRIDMDDRIALIGANGNGKTTLARLLAGRLAPMAGGLIRANRLEVGYFAQDQADALRAGATPIEHLAALLPDANETALRARLGRFALAEDQARTTVDKLSGGERARLCFALVSAGAPQILVLDEPSNHLDVDARAALEDAINGYRGAVILITHDRRLIELCADRL